MRSILTVTALFLSFISYAQSITVETIVFTETLNKSSQSDIPFVIDNTGTKGAAVKKINDAILDRFMIDSFDPQKVSEFLWYGVEFDWEVKSDILFISFSGEYSGAYLNQVTEHLYFDLFNGNQLEEKLLTFNTFFSLNGYFAFLDRHWLPDCNREFNTAKECTEFEPYCDCYDIDILLSKNNITFSLTHDCFPHAAQACDPFHSVDIPKDSLKPYLSEFGQYVLFKTSYSNMSTLEKFLFYRENSPKIPNLYFIVGSIDGKYPFSMAIELNEKTKKVSGYYFYQKQHERINVQGSFDQTKIYLTESVGNKVTGKFEFTWHSAYQEGGLYLADNNYWAGKWIDPAGKMLSVGLNDVKYKF
ncbi:MAG TPA: hypothetical protein VIN08_13315 [Ohtaekwangia sp.]|uniref:hypothetical protein n=1 Tax=Ohtaekwangia sp. TaxID=2066019 RepID=UPI002F94A759